MNGAFKGFPLQYFNTPGAERKKCKETLKSSPAEKTKEHVRVIILKLIDKK